MRKVKGYEKVEKFDVIVIRKDGIPKYDLGIFYVNPEEKIVHKPIDSLQGSWFTSVENIKDRLKKWSEDAFEYARYDISDPDVIIGIREPDGFFNPINDWEVLAVDLYNYMTKEGVEEI